jgi:hypothetical protein
VGVTEMPFGGCGDAGCKLHPFDYSTHPYKAISIPQMANISESIPLIALLTFADPSKFHCREL